MAHNEESWILDFLKSQPKCSFTASQIARKAADRQFFETNPRWAIPVLARMREKDLVDVDDAGHYRFMDPMMLTEKREKARNRMGR